MNEIIESPNINTNVPKYQMKSTEYFCDVFGFILSHRKQFARLREH